MKRAVLGVVLWGGQSRRMGTDKGLQEIRPGQRQIDYLLSVLEPFCRELALSVGPDKEAPGIPDSVLRIHDEPEIGGPMAGVLAALKSSEGRPVLVVACDMPFVERADVLQLLERREPSALATCFLAADGRPEPMFAVYEQSSFSLMQDFCEEGRRSLRAFLEKHDSVLIEPQRRLSVTNVNTPEDLDQAKGKLCDGAGSGLDS